MQGEWLSGREALVEGGSAAGLRLTCVERVEERADGSREVLL